VTDLLFQDQEFRAPAHQTLLYSVAAHQAIVEPAHFKKTLLFQGLAVRLAKPGLQGATTHRAVPRHLQIFMAAASH
jgi:hypothetical protein